MDLGIAMKSGKNAVLRGQYWEFVWNRRVYGNANPEKRPQSANCDWFLGI